MSIQPGSLVIGFGVAVAAALLAIVVGLRHLKSLSLREQLAGVTEPTVNRTIQLKRIKRARRRAIVCTVMALLMLSAIVMGWIPAAGAFFGVGLLLLVGSLSFLSSRLQSDLIQGTGPNSSTNFLRGHGQAAFGRLSLRNASRQRVRTITTTGLIATATFLIVTVAAFRRDPTSELPDRSSGNGGFTLVAESSSPVLYDINTPEGRKKLQIEVDAGSQQSQAFEKAGASERAKALEQMKVVPFRVKPGEDASCLNLYQTRLPTILGVPQSLIEEGRFAFASGSWKGLQEKSDDGSIPVLGDMNTLMFSLHKQVGQTIQIPNDEHPQHTLKIKGMFQDSVFQGVIVMSEENFLKLFPEQKGFRYFLIEVPNELAAATSELLESELSAYGFDTEPVADRLARFLSVQNTYLSTFQTLGGLGLLLGTIGLATV
ncbi:MAG: hypothetical protein FJ267_14605, partial [Planctomycetes bacterium]|nr:hypothetical protein [Planctomycetota bacterium]